MTLHTIDWVIAIASIVICFLPALAFGKRSGANTAEFFASGRSVPWWLAGISMVATTFSSDTPNLVANFVRTQGVAGNWQWWAFIQNKGVNDYKVNQANAYRNKLPNIQKNTRRKGTPPILRVFFICIDRYAQFSKFTHLL
jgi:hypothetical protein